MKNPLAIQKLRSISRSKPLCTETASYAIEGALERARDSRAILVGLMMPTVTVTLYVSMFAVALPSIRSSFDAQADLIAWIVTGYSLSFVILMPLYGRLGDGLGKRKLFLIGIVVFLIGTCISFLAPDLRLLVMGRVIQGAGASGIIPLAIAIISELFPVSQRGKALGTWNSIGPVARIAGPLMAGLLIVVWGWRTIFGPPLLVGLLAPFVVCRCIPSVRGNARSGFLHGFDWMGVVLLGAGVMTFLFYVSSRPITGISPFQDVRLLAAALLLMGGFVFWERRQTSPFISFELFSRRLFTSASLCAGLRMFTMSGIGFLLPLYLTDVRGLSAAWIGVVLVIHSGGLLVTLRLGGQLADRLGSSRWPVVLGMSMQIGAMITFATLSGGAALSLVIIGLAVHGLGAGLALAALHRAAMGQIPQAQMGLAAGLYSMIRFFGTALGMTLGGALLQQGLDRGLPTIDAYQTVYWVIAGSGLAGVITGLTLNEKKATGQTSS